MDRKDFIKSCGFTCLGGLALPALLQGCSPAKLVNAKISGDDLVIPVNNFQLENGKQGYKKYVVFEDEILLYPICVYRFSETEYSALWMRCTHQGTELQVFGDTLQCPAHGSEFTNTGSVHNGPAENPLRTFPVRVENHQIKISLKAPR